MPIYKQIGFSLKMSILLGDHIFLVKPNFLCALSKYQTFMLASKMHNNAA